MKAKENQERRIYRLIDKLTDILAITQDTTPGMECWQKIQNIEATAANALAVARTTAPALSIARRRKMADWQPIDTAPPDFGIQVWGWDENRGSNPIILCEDGWRITYDDVLINPTHWMPLPEPPKK